MEHLCARSRGLIRDLARVPRRCCDGNMLSTYNLKHTPHHTRNHSTSHVTNPILGTPWKPEVISPPAFQQAQCVCPCDPIYIQLLPRRTSRATRRWSCEASSSVAVTLRQGPHVYVTRHPSLQSFGRVPRSPNTRTRQPRRLPPLPTRQYATQVVPVITDRKGKRRDDGPHSRPSDSLQASLASARKLHTLSSMRRHHIQILDRRYIHSTAPRNAIPLIPAGLGILKVGEV